MSRGLAYLFIALSLLFQILSMVLGKVASLTMGAFTARGVLGNGYYLGCLACLVLQAGCWSLALRRFPLFYAYLFMSGVYLAIPVAGHYLFHESVSLANLGGAALIAGGILLLLGGGQVEHG